MGKTVFILGAGASRQAGGPLMADFLDKARYICDSGRAGDVEDAFKLVFKARTQIKAAHSMSTVNIDNIEHVFATFEMAELLGRLGNLSPEELGELGSAIRKLIRKTIEVEILFKERNGHILAPEPYGNFGVSSAKSGFLALIAKMHQEQANPPCIITFNYDLALDYGFNTEQYSLKADYALSDMEAAEASIPVLKLHGSLNWAKCNNKECDRYDKISYWLPKGASRAGGWAHIGEKVEKSDAGTIRNADPGLFRIDSSQDKDRSCVTCLKSLDIVPIIVPPTWNKAPHYEEIGSVWKRAAEELSEAENIFIIGYSWPSNDHFFDSLYSLGTISYEDTYFRKRWVFNPDAKLAKHFGGMLGQAARKRYRFYKADFAEAIGMMRTVLLYGNSDPREEDEAKYRVIEKPE